MGFKKISIEEIKTAKFNNFIGVPEVSQEVTQKNIESSNNLRVGEISNSADTINFKDGKSLEVIFEDSSECAIDQLKNSSLIKNERWLSLRNPSLADKVWNLKFEVKDQDQVFNVSSLDPSTDWHIQLDQESEEIKNPLMIVECISRSEYPTDMDMVSDNYLNPTEYNIVFVTIFVQNISAQTLYNLELIKYLPNSLIKIHECDKSDGSLSIERNQIRWDLASLESKSIQKFKFKLQLESKAVDFGKITISYHLKLNQNAESLIKRFNGAGKIGQFILMNQKDDAPGMWDCSINVMNRSEIKFNVEKCELTEDTDDGLKIIKNESLNRTLNPFEEVTILTATIESITRPKLLKNVGIYPCFTTTHNQIGLITIESQKIQLLNLNAQKTFSITTLKSFESAVFDSNLAIKNLSSVPINNFLIVEAIPFDFAIAQLPELGLKIQGESMMLREYQKAIKNQIPAEELRNLTESIASMDDQLSSALAELDQNRIQIVQLNTPQIELDKTNLLETQKTLKQQIEDLKEESANLKKHIEDLDNQIQLQTEHHAIADNNLQTSLNIKTSLETEIKLKKEIDTQKKALDKLLSQKDSFENQLNSIPQESVNEEISVSEEAIASQNKKKTELSKKLDNINNQSTALQQKIESLENKLTELQNNLPSDDTVESINAKIQIQESEIAKIDAKLIELENNKQVQVENGLNFDQNLQQTIQTINDNDQEIDRLTAIQKNGTQLSQNNSIIQQKVNQINDQRNLALNRKKKLEMVFGSNNSIDQIIAFLLDDFQKNASDNNKDQFEPFIITDQIQGNLIFIQLNNLSAFFKSVDPQDTLEVSYTISTEHPRNDVDYHFSTTIYYKSENVQKVEKYEIPKFSQPKLEIIHNRQKLSLGKLVEPIKDAGKFAITLLLKNSGNMTIENLQISDSIPKDAEILNAYYHYEEVIETDTKKINWYIERLLPFQEMQISYLVDLHEEWTDLTLFKVEYKEEE